MSIEFYEQNAQLFFDGTIDVDMRDIYERFTKGLSKGCYILDAGCGSGRDTKAFLDMGYKVDAFDASEALCELSSKQTGIEVKHATFNDVTAVSQYDAIWCCASLLHVPENELQRVLNKLATSLKAGGIWYVSFKYGDGERVKGGRHFTDLNEHKLELLVSELPNITVKTTWVSEDNRPDRNERWLNALLAKV
ncbi:class I SAM-dependent methyltransferase [Pseudoalteromonas sp. CO325X]|uniref:class I SAM-dependent methyltransferase n=1 Tax=Pseudoalteromonas sp. CO325X TaxID=1777262 RepID=UPI001022B100|nr:class I SAM-dependent methyltransferase [Pseudoalteromonas sp. CO325X]RZF80537.1 class I SAM-dependent methyltransferase [Pseudoalteromonas sp. CO325X]